VSKKGDPDHLPYGFLLLLDIPSKSTIPSQTQLASRLPLSLGHRSIRKLMQFISNTNLQCNTNLTTKLYGCFLKWWYLPKHPQKIIFSRKTHGFVGETHHFRKPPFWTKMQSLSKTSSLTQDELHALSSSCRFHPGMRTGPGQVRKQAIQFIKCPKLKTWIAC